MKPFYLTKNAQGYYRAVFYNQQTGTFSSSKSTHSKDKTEAMLIAADWYKNGIPVGYTNSRSKNSDSKDFTSGLNIQNIVNRLSQNEAVLLVSLISQRFNLSAPNISLKFSVNINQETTPAPVNYALGFYVRANLLLLFSRIRQAVEPDKGVKPKNVRNMIFLCRGAVKAARIIGGEVGEVEERRIEI